VPAGAGVVSLTPARGRSLPGIFYRHRLGPNLLGLAVGACVLLGILALSAARPGARLRRRLAPHVESERKRAEWQAPRERFATASAILRATERAFGNLRLWRRLHALIDRPNLLVKIPATKPGLAAVEDMIARGKSINVTLIFSLERYAAVAESYLRGLERLVASGGDPTAVASVASFFVSRVDTEADRRLELLGGGGGLEGKLAVANAKLAYRRYAEVFSGERWEFLAGKGARPQRCLWASTSTKNPAYRDVLYVEELIGPMTVNTMPEETIRAFQDHGRVADTLTQGLGEAEALLDALAEAGVDYEDVTETLEREGVEKFADSFAELLDGIRSKSGDLLAA